MPELISIVGLSRSSIYASIKAGTFPAPVPIGPRMSAWDSDSISEWVDAKIGASKSTLADRFAVGRRLLEARTRKSVKRVAFVP